MSYSISTLKTDLTGKLHGTSLSKIQGINNIIDEAARQVLQDVDPYETIKQAQITNGVYDSVYDYQLPSDLKGTKIVDIRPQANRGLEDRFFNRFSEDFDLRKADGTFSFSYNGSVRSLRLSRAINDNVTIHQMNSLTENGTWAATSDATNLTTDNVYYISGSTSLKFDLNGSTTAGYIENSTMTQLDLSDYEDQGSIFLWAYFPDSSIITNLILRWGNDSSNYWQATATTPHNETSFSDGWNLIRFDWNGATEVNGGSIDSETVDYARVTITYDGTADTDIRIDNIVIRLQEILELEYYSKYIFRDSSTNAFAENVASDNDLVNLDTDSYNLLLYKVAELAAINQQGVDSTLDYQIYRDNYERAVRKYKMMYPSQFKKPQVSYYNITSGNRTNDINS